MVIDLKSKDFDAWVSFLKRINGIGRNYIIKNDIYLATDKKNKSGTNVKIAGRHLFHDPLFNDNDVEIQEIIYVLKDIDDLLNEIKDVTEEDKELRKGIIYSRDTEGIYIDFPNGHSIAVALVIDNPTLFLDNDVLRMITTISRQISTFSELLKFPEIINSNWINIDRETLISIRDGSPITISQTVNDKKMYARIAKSVFVASGASRFGNPIAEEAKYAFIPPRSDNNVYTGLLELYARYKTPGTSKLINIECIHEYVVLIYEEEEE